MRAKLRCRGCENGREQPRNRLCPTCKRIVREQQEARARKEQEARKRELIRPPCTLAELTLLFETVQARRAAAKAKLAREASAGRQLQARQYSDGNEASP